ncbi:MAG: OmpA family protein [Bradyrhizobiaceae bacterium]|nr:OmpA family protein [Bradyrhizobiaceae bacterium]
MRLRILAVATLVLTVVGTLSAQERGSVPFRYGAHLGLNYNMAGVGYSRWIESAERPFGSYIPYVRNDGNGLGLYAGLNAQWMLLDVLGLQTRLSYDNRYLQAIDDQSYTAADGSAIKDEYDFMTSLVNIDVLAKWYLGNEFHLTGGGGLGFKLNSTYDYRMNSVDPQVKDVEVPGSAIVGSAVIGLGYDIPLSEASAKSQMFLTPFLEMSYAMGMRTPQFEFQSGLADGLSIVTLRAGVAVTMGDVDGARSGDMGSGKFFMITPPEDGIHAHRIVEERFPLRPFVFFDSANTAIPSRYNNINAGDTNGLIDRAMTQWTADNIDDLQERKYLQGEVYYNLLNIIGYRANRTPNAQLTLVGSDPREKNGQTLAETVKNYLVNTWNIAPDRITVKGQLNPKRPSGTDRTPPEDKPFAEAENRRVEVESNVADITRRAVLKTEQPAREENQVNVKITTNENIESWQMTISGNGERKSYGPFTGREAYIDPTGLLKDGQSEETFTAEVIAKTTDGRTLSDAATFELKMSNESSHADRYTLIFEYNDDDPIGRTRDFINDLVPHIPNGATIFISGYTDNLGKEDVNMKLSQSRADQVKAQLEQGLKAAGKKATIRATGYGEDPTYTPFSNNLPEGRMYNRTVIVDILP